MSHPSSPHTPDGADDRICWTVRVDRRVVTHDAAVSTLFALAEGVAGIGLTLVTHEAFEASPDSGTFRDFIPVATITHTHTIALDFFAELCLESFGFVVDFVPRAEA